MQKSNQSSQPPEARTSSRPPKLPGPSTDRPKGKFMAIEGDYVVVGSGDQKEILGKFMSVELLPDLIKKMELPAELQQQALQDPQSFIESFARHIARNGFKIANFIQSDRDTDCETFVIYKPIQ